MEDSDVRQRLAELLDSRNPDAGRRCDSCGMRDGHHLIYCYRCPGRFVDVTETWRESILRSPNNRNWVSNRLCCLERAYQRRYCVGTTVGGSRQQLKDSFDAIRPLFRRLTLEACGLDPRLLDDR